MNIFTWIKQWWQGEPSIYLAGSKKCTESIERRQGIETATLTGYDIRRSWSVEDREKHLSTQYEKLGSLRKSYAEARRLHAKSADLNVDLRRQNAFTISLEFELFEARAERDALTLEKEDE